MTAPSKKEMDAQASRIIALALKVTQDYRELHDEAYGMTTRDKAHIQRGEAADPTFEVFASKRVLQGRCSSIARSMERSERKLRELSNFVARALTTETVELDDGDGDIVSAAERDRIHRKREEEMRSA